LALAAGGGQFGADQHRPPEQRRGIELEAGKNEAAGGVCEAGERSEVVRVQEPGRARSVGGRQRLVDGDDVGTYGHLAPDAEAVELAMLNAHDAAEVQQVALYSADNKQ
jgi:hypothetical protein